MFSAVSAFCRSECSAAICRASVVPGRPLLSASAVAECHRLLLQCFSMSLATAVAACHRLLLQCFSLPLATAVCCCSVPLRAVCLRGRCSVSLRSACCSSARLSAAWAGSPCWRVRRLPRAAAGRRMCRFSAAGCRMCTSASLPL